MNPQQTSKRIHPTTYLTVVITTIIVAYGGARYAVVKNSQTQTARANDAIERRIEQTRLDIRMIEMKREIALNRFAMRKKLAESGTTLQSIPPGFSEEIDPTGAASVANIP